jgi:FkbM family methyltransferase
VVRFLLFLSPESRIQLVTFNGSARLFADIRDPFARNYFLIGGFDLEFFSIAKPFLLDGGVFFDVGANFGFCSFGLIECLGRRDVEYHLFEANKGICDLLFLSAKLYPGQTIWINYCCVADCPGVSKLNISPDNFGASFISEKGTQEVENLILDDYIYDRSIKKINLLKVDVEGWEARVLRGAMNGLTSGIVDAAYIEVSTENLSRAGFSVEECFTLLREAGFYLFYVREKDFESGIADKRKAFNLYIHGCPITVAELDGFPTDHITDILAIHRSSNLLGGWRD